MLARAALACALVAALGAAGCRGPYRDVAERIANDAGRSDGAYVKVAALATEVGARLSGTPALERAIAWARDTLARDGHENVALEPVTVPHWSRGAEAAEIVAPAPRKLAVLALGGSVGTPPEGVTAEVAVVSTFEELAALGAGARGKIVLFDHAMRAGEPPGASYGHALPFRREGASRAAKLGAVAVLVRSLTARSLGAPHTGAMKYADDGSPRIPAAAISVEDAELLARLAHLGPVKVHLALGAETHPGAPSANVIAELRGRERPDEIVVISAHLDSWDVGQGAQDDGAGCAIVMESLATLRRLGLRPRRTIRVVLYTNEENGGAGANGYAAAHAAELPRHVAAFEVDSGAGAPRGFSTDGPQPWAGDAKRLANLLAPIRATAIIPSFPGEDIMALKRAGVPLLGLSLDNEHYFDVHHSVADTLDKIDPANLRRDVAALATMAYVVADRAETWRR
jgi:Zn-dependent M28 family amino/carboxypeptidase